MSRLRKGRQPRDGCSTEDGRQLREGLRRGVEQCLAQLANAFLRQPANFDNPDSKTDCLSASRLYQQLLVLVYRVLFLLMSDDRGLLHSRPRDVMRRLRSLIDDPAACADDEELWPALRGLWLGSPGLTGELFAPQPLDDCALANCDLLSALRCLDGYSNLKVEELGGVYEGLLELHPTIATGNRQVAFAFVSGSQRKTTGSFYTPPELIAELVSAALEPVIAERLAALSKSDPRELREEAILSIRVCDPACGSGHFLLAAARRLGMELARVRTGEEHPAPERVREAIGDCVSHCLYGVDRNPLAVNLCRIALWLESESSDQPLTFLDHRIRCGDSLVGVLDWPLEFPDVFAAGGFDAVLGNPPWGAHLSDADKQVARARFPASRRGTIDTFALFTELGSRVLKPGGWLGLVLPDIILLKNYPAIRRHLLESMELRQIAHWGQAFDSANIDVCTLTARLGSPPPGHTVQCIPEIIGGDARTSPVNLIKQQTFLDNKQYRLNLQLSDSALEIIGTLRALGPPVGEVFVIREGVHSGNVRARLFLEQPEGSQCQPLVFGRDEIEPMQIRWAGKYVQLDQHRFDRAAGDYFNLGDTSLYSADKLLVRRTGDFVLCAVDFEGRFCSNNFFLLVPRANVSRHKLVYAAACLNSPLATQFFRLIQPRVGKLFAELKITHLEEIPLPFWDDPWAERAGAALAKALASRDGIDKALNEFNAQLLARSDRSAEKNLRRSTG